MNKIAILTVNYNNYSITQELILYFKSQKNTNFKLYIADLSENKKAIPETIPFEILSGKNDGYAYGINLGLKAAVKDGYEKFIVLNNDIRLSNDFIERVSKSLENHPKSIIGGKIYYEAGFEFHKEKYAKSDLGKVIWYAGGNIDWPNMIVSHRGVDEVDKEQYDSFEQTEFVTGCLIFFDKSVLDTVGLWDESYFLYYEDTDFCERAKRKGIPLLYDPGVVIWHKNAQSTGGAGSKLHLKYQEKNRLKFGLKYAPFRTKVHLLKRKLDIMFFPP